MDNFRKWLRWIRHVSWSSSFFQADVARWRSPTVQRWQSSTVAQLRPDKWWRWRKDDDVLNEIECIYDDPMIPCQILFVFPSVFIGRYVSKTRSGIRWCHYRTQVASTNLSSAFGWYFFAASKQLLGRRFILEWSVGIQNVRFAMSGLLYQSLPYGSQHCSIKGHLFWGPQPWAQTRSLYIYIHIDSYRHTYILELIENGRQHTSWPGLINDFCWGFKIQSIFVMLFPMGLWTWRWMVPKNGSPKKRCAGS